MVAMAEPTDKREMIGAGYVAEDDEPTDEGSREDGARDESVPATVPETDDYYTLVRTR